MLGLPLLLVGASARFFVPAAAPAAPAPEPAARASRAAPLPVVGGVPPLEFLAAPRVVPVVAVTPPADEQASTLSFYAGLTAGLSVLALGATSARKAQRRGAAPDQGRCRGGRGRRGSLRDPFFARKRRVDL